MEWYDDLVADIRKLEFTGVVVTKWHIGQRILKDELKFQKPEYGSKRMENLAKDTGQAASGLWLCVQAARKWPTKEQFSTAVENLPWREVRKLLPPQEKPDTQIPLLPVGKYNIIYADPPWEYYAGGYKNQSQHYDGILAEDIPTLKDPMGHTIAELAAEDCMLFLWGTWPILDKLFDVMEGWGFQYSTIGFVWVKSLKDGTGFFFGNGNWTRANTEFCLIGRRGKIERQSASISQIIYEPIREHSRKPDCVRDKIVELVGNLPRIELFARRAESGWDVWGNEV